MRRTLSTLTAMAVGAATLTAAATTATASAEESSADRGAASVDKPLWQQAQNYYSTLRAPRLPDETEIESAEGPRAEPTWWEEAQRKHSTGFPPAAQELARREALADKGLSPARSLRKAGAEKVTEAKLLTLLVEFDPDANDDFSGWERPADNPTEEEPCFTEPEGTFFGGPLHNELPNPATVGTGRDNNTFWVPDFSPEHYEKIIYSEEGLTEKVRPDLNGGIDLSGYTVRNHYKEMSSGKYLIDGTVTPWLMLPHSEAWYSADSCAAGEASDVGHPDNPRGTAQMAIDAVAALAEADPDFNFAEYDQEDQADFDDDGDLFEPDGVLDHVVVIHSGADQADDGGEQGTYAEWSSSSTVDPAQGGYEVPGTGVKVFNYTTQPEDAGVGVISHEYGHDLGLPDLYDSIGPTDTDVAFWDLMSTGSHSGPIFQGIPTHMGAWSKYVLGWIDPEVVPYGSARRNVTLGQAAKVPAGTESAVKIQLPNKDVQVGEPHSGEFAWWSSNDQDDADVRLTRSVDVPEGTDVRFWMWNNYNIEEFWDYGFVEVSTDDGATWEQMVVRDESGEEVSTNEDPNFNMESYFGGLENGLTGTTNGYRHDWIDLSEHTGETVQVRLRYMTDAAFVETGWFADDFSVTADGTEVWSDDVESGDNGWTQEVLSIGGGNLGAGWIRTSGSFSYEQYYLAEWRNTVGFDKGLLTPYATNFHVDGEWNVNRMPYNAPGMLLWHRDASHSFNDISNNLYDPPSIGAKGQVLLVDSHFNPRRLRGAAAEANPSVLDNLDSRAQAQDVAFGPTKRGFEYCYPSSSTDPYATACNWFGPRPAKNYFTDQRTWYPGLEYRPDLLEETGSDLFFRDNDASTVVPSRNNQFYTTRITDKNGKPIPELFGFDFGDGHVFGTGHPKDGRPATEDDPGTKRDLSLGVRVKVVGKAADNSRAKVWLQPGYRR